LDAAARRLRRALKIANLFFRIVARMVIG